MSTGSAAPENVAEALEHAFRTEAPAIFSGLALASDGTIEIFVTEETSAVKAAIKASQAKPVSIRVLSGRTNTLATLERIRDEIRREGPALTMRGLKLTQLGVDIHANKVLIGVESLDDATRDFLNGMYGGDRVQVVEGSRWRTTPLIGRSQIEE
jgi:hypothetical protein